MSSFGFLDIWGSWRFRLPKRSCQLFVGSLRIPGEFPLLLECRVLDADLERKPSEHYTVFSPGSSILLSHWIIAFVVHENED